ncbi:MAG TPA: phosphotriesterase-related protein [bacterium]|nr:phosphotriesterase-related protein [bacterium]
MKVARTVRGDIPVEQLGICYPHEHVLGGPPEPLEDRDLLLDSEEAARRELAWFREAGGRSLVEMSPPDYRRDPEGLRRISEAADVHIICTTGYHKDIFSAPYVADRSVEELTNQFVREITEGINGSGIKAGVIKAGTMKNDLSAHAEKVLRAAARAQQATGAPVSTHTDAGTMGPEQVNVLKSEGADLSRVIIGHLDRQLEWAYHQQIAETGVTLGFDQISKGKYSPDRKRIEFILRLVEAGYGQQITFSGDLARKSYWPGYGTGGGPGLTYILWRFVPWLREEGLEEEVIRDILVNTPARIFGIETD